MRKRMPDAEKEYTTLTRLALISRRAKEELRCQFTSLAHFLNEGFLQDCYFGLGKDRPSGVDGISWKKYGEHLEENLKDLVKRMKAKRYKPQPARRIYISKDEHSKRPLGLPALEDKIVQKGVPGFWRRSTRRIFWTVRMVFGRRGTPTKPSMQWTRRS
jgi:hypothetical protein